MQQGGISTIKLHHHRLISATDEIIFNCCTRSHQDDDDYDEEFMGDIKNAHLIANKLFMRVANCED